MWKVSAPTSDRMRRDLDAELAHPDDLPGLLLRMTCPACCRRNPRAAGLEQRPGSWRIADRSQCLLYMFKGHVVYLRLPYSSGTAADAALI